jgi:hypothetical protein
VRLLAAHDARDERARHESAQGGQGGLHLEEVDQAAGGRGITWQEIGKNKLEKMKGTEFLINAFHNDISHRLGGITPCGVVFTDAFPGPEMREQHPFLPWQPCFT